MSGISLADPSVDTLQQVINRYGRGGLSRNASFAELNVDCHLLADESHRSTLNTTHSKTMPIMRNTTPRCVKLLLLLVACSIAGCVQEKESLHEHEHEAPRHWPEDMSEAAEFIEIRVGQLETSDAKLLERLEEELQDLVEWAPEIAADTDLAEQDWLPVYEMSEAIRRHLSAGNVSAVELTGDLEKLASLLRQANAKLPSVDQGHEQDRSETPAMDIENTTISRTDELAP